MIRKGLFCGEINWSCFITINDYYHKVWYHIYTEIIQRFVVEGHYEINVILILQKQEKQIKICLSRW